MDDPMAQRTWLGRFIYLGLACVIFFFRLLPLNAVPGGLPGPDLLLAMTLAWLIRRPEQVPAPLIAGVFLMADMLFLRPPGLWTLIVLGATEFVRSRSSPTRDVPLAAEMGLIAILVITATVVELIALSIFLLPKPGLGIALLQALFTLVAYPVIVAALSLGLGLRRIAPGDVYDQGRRL